MKMITVLNIVFGVVAVLWAAAALFVTIFVFDSPTATLLNRLPYLVLVWSMPVLTVVSVVLSRASGPQSGIYFAWLPALPLALGLFVVGKEIVSDRATARENRSFVASLSKDYVCGKVSGHGEDEFLTVSAERGTIVHITPYGGMTAADPVGKIEGPELRLFPFHESVRAEREAFYKACLDAEGKSVYDRYSVTWDENGNDFNVYDLDVYRKK